MGQVCNKASKELGLRKVNEVVNAEPNISGCTWTPGSGQVRVLMTCLDYKETEQPLTATADGKNIKVLLDACGVTDITYLENLECTKDNVGDALEAVIDACEEGDFFIYYYSGHGTQVPDKDGDEADGKDEALCLVDGDTGQIGYDTVMIDDDFCDIVTTALAEKPWLPSLIITDCCHSGTIADTTDADWDGLQVVALSGCTDEQTSGDTGKGGIMTASLLYAIDQLQDEGKTDYTVAELYNYTLDNDDLEFASAQDISISASPNFAPNMMPWPLIPKKEWSAPTV